MRLSDPSNAGKRHPLLAFAERYNVRFTSAPADYDPDDPGFRAFNSVHREWSMVPSIAAAVNPFRRLVWIDALQPTLDLEPTELFHEICHVICAPPFIGVHAPEEWLQLPFELYARRSAGISATAWAAFAANAPIDAHGGAPYGGIAHPRDTAWWAAGVARARAVGLLGPDNRPTGRLPDWSGITMVDIKTMMGWF